MARVLVVGGGPAGLLAAETMAKAGLQVSLIEAKPGRVRPCAGLTSLATLEAFGLPEALASQGVTELTVHSPMNRRAYWALGGPGRGAVALDGAKLLASLQARAEAAGVQCLHGRFTRFRHGEGDYPEVEYQLPDGRKVRLGCEVVVAADGVASRVARAMGLEALPRGVAYQERLALPPARVRPPDAPEGILGGPREAAHLVLGRKVSADAFGYVVPHREQLVVGLRTKAAFGRRVWDGLAELKRRLGPLLDEAQGLGSEAFMVPLGLRERLVVDRVLFIGDAAGACLPASQDALHWALLGAKLAAEAVIAARHVPTEDNLRAYEEAWRAQWGPLAQAEARLLERFGGADRRREALLDLAWDREVQALAVEAHLGKVLPTVGLAVGVRVKAKATFQRLRHGFFHPRRIEQEHLARQMPPAPNYLDQALASGTGPLPRRAPELGVPAPTEAELAAVLAAEAAEAPTGAPKAPEPPPAEVTPEPEVLPPAF